MVNPVRSLQGGGVVPDSSMRMPEMCVCVCVCVTWCPFISAQEVGGRCDPGDEGEKCDARGSGGEGVSMCVCVCVCVRVCVSEFWCVCV